MKVEHLYIFNIKTDPREGEIPSINSAYALMTKSKENNVTKNIDLYQIDDTKESLHKIKNWNESTVEGQKYKTTGAYIVGHAVTGALGELGPDKLAKLISSEDFPTFDKIAFDACFIANPVAKKDFFVNDYYEKSHQILKEAIASQKNLSFLQSFYFYYIKEKKIATDGKELIISGWPSFVTVRNEENQHLYIPANKHSKITKEGDVGIGRKIVASPGSKEYSWAEEKREKYKMSLYWSAKKQITGNATFELTENFHKWLKS